MAESLNKSYSNFSQRLRDLPAGARLTILFLLLLVLASIWIMVPSAENNEEYLFGGREFSNLELAAMEQAFATASLNESQIVGSRMQVPGTKKSQYLASLQGVFEPKHLNSDVDDVLKENDWWGSSELRKLRLKNATEKDLSRTIAMMPGIEEAKVSIDESISQGLQRQTERTALAAVKPIGNMQLAARTAESIREVVSARYTGLMRDGVTVIDLNSGEVFGSSSPQSPWSIPDDPYAIRKRYYEREWRSKIQDMVSMIPGVKVQVNVVLEEAADVHPQQASTGTTLVPIKGIASIAIPQSYYRMIYDRKQNQAVSTGSSDPETAELEAIEAEIGEAVRRMVVGLLPNLSAGNNPYPQVQVSSYLDFPQPSVATPGTSLVTISDWLTTNWRPVTLGMLGLLIILILVLKFRRQKESLPAESGQRAVEAAETENRPLDMPGPSLRDELAQLVQEEPDTVVDTISEWLKDAA